MTDDPTCSICGASNDAHLGLIGSKLTQTVQFLQSSNSASCGGVFCDHEGRFNKAFSCKLGICSITHAKIWDCIYALRLARDLHIQKIHLELETDSACVIHFLSSGYPSTHLASPLIKETRRLVIGSLGAMSGVKQTVWLTS